MGFNVVYQQFRAMYDRSAVTGPYSNRVLMPQINMIPHPVTLNWHRANQPCYTPLMVNS